MPERQHGETEPHYEWHCPSAVDPVALSNNMCQNVLSHSRKILNTVDILYMDGTHYCMPNYNRDILCVEQHMERCESQRALPWTDGARWPCVHQQYFSLGFLWHDEAWLYFMLSYAYDMQPVAVFMFLGTLVMWHQKWQCQSVNESPALLHTLISQQLFMAILIGTWTRHRWWSLNWLVWLAFSTTDRDRDITQL